MKPPPFEYVRPTSLDEAVAILARYGDEAKPLAGGQSLLPMMNFRLARPAVLVDLERVPSLDGVEVDSEVVRIGAMTRQADALATTSLRDRHPLLAAALRQIGHHQIRTRGTIGGSLAHADPAAELPALAVLTDARLSAHGPSGDREIAAADFFLGPFTTALADDELLTGVRFPTDGLGAWAFEELTRRGGDFAIAGLAAVRGTSGVRLVAFGLGWVPLRLQSAEVALADAGVVAGGPIAADDVDAAAAAAHDEIDPFSDIHADAEYRRAAIATLVRRTLRALSA